MQSVRVYEASATSRASLLGAATENLGSPAAFHSTNSSPHLSSECTIGTSPDIICLKSCRTASNISTPFTEDVL